MTCSEPAAWWRLVTPAGAAGGVAIVQITGDCDAAMRKLGIPALPVGGVRLVEIAGGDRAVVARFAHESVQIMPHGGTEVVRAVLGVVRAAGLGEWRAGSPSDRWADADAAEARELYPEASDELEARMLHALSRAQSELSIDLLLDQPRRWHGQPPRDADERDRVLHRLIEPALVVAVGASNIGKSTLLNALAGRGVAIVADEPGTTRDHVGACIDLAGVVVRYVDTPGVRANVGPEERAASGLALRLAEHADAVLLCGDRDHPPPEGVRTRHDAAVLRVALRADLGVAAWRSDAVVSAASGAGLAELVALLRDRVVPPELVCDPRSWRFW